jgi:tetratricopeptide (TPR) repeat protein
MFAVVLSGCPKKAAEPIFIPEQNTAYDQFRYAEYLRRSLVPSPDQERRAEQMTQVIEAYERVYELFPDDIESTPQAKLMVGMLYARTPNQKDKAIEMLREVELRYSNNDDILARSLYHQGLLMDQARRYEEAQYKYKEVVDRYGTSEDPVLLRFARQARERYNRVRTWQ